MNAIVVNLHDFVGLLYLFFQIIIDYRFRTMFDLIYNLSFAINLEIGDDIKVNILYSCIYLLDLKYQILFIQE